MRGQKEVRLIFGSVKVEVITRPASGQSVPAQALEVTISLSEKESLVLRGQQVEDFMQCMEALANLKRRGRDE